MNEQPLVSIIIPTHNRQGYLKRAIKSVLCQTYQNIEIVVIDDGSTDETPKIVSELAKKEPRITALKNEINLGFVKTLNRGINRARGKYIARLDDDDFWVDPKKLEKQVGFLERHPDYVLVGGGVIKIDKEGKELVRYLLPEKDEVIRRSILIDNLFAHSAVLFKKDAWERAGGYDGEFGFFADRDLWLKLGKLGKFYNFQEYFVYYLRPEDERTDRLIRRRLGANIKLRRKYRSDYPGFWPALLLCFASYFYSFLPSKQKLRPVLFKLREIILGPPVYKYFKK